MIRDFCLSLAGPKELELGIQGADRGANECGIHVAVENTVWRSLSPLPSTRISICSLSKSSSLMAAHSEQRMPEE